MGIQMSKVSSIMQELLPKDLVNHIIQPMLMISQQQVRDNHTKVMEQLRHKFTFFKASGHIRSPYWGAEGPISEHTVFEITLHKEDDRTSFFKALSANWEPLSAKDI